MKKTICVFLAILMLFSIVACNEEFEQENIPVEPEQENNPVEYQFYVDGFDNDSVNEIDTTNQVVFENYSALKFNSLGENVDKNEDTEQLKSMSFDGQEYLYEYLSTSDRKITTHTDYRSQYGKYDRYTYRYKNGFDLIAVELYSETGQLRNYFNTSVIDTSGDFTKEQAMEKGKEIIYSLYGADSLDGYTLRTSVTDKSIGIVAERMFGNYHTMDFIAVDFGFDGRLYMIQAEEFHSFDLFEKDLTEQMIENACEALMDNLSEDYVVQNEYQTLRFEENSGKLFLTFFAFDRLADDKYEEFENSGNMFCVNVN